MRHHSSDILQTNKVLLVVTGTVVNDSDWFVTGSVVDNVVASKVLRCGVVCAIDVVKFDVDAARYVERENKIIKSIESSNEIRRLYLYFIL